MSANPLESAILALHQGKAYEKNGNYSEAIKSYRIAAKSDVVEAQFALGHLYHQGAEGVEEDYKEAIFWYKKAALQQHTGALFSLGFMSHFGQGMSKNDKVALNLYNKAASQGHADAQFYLGRLYQFSSLSFQSDSDAVRYYALAAAQNHDEAEISLQTMANTGNKAAIAALKVIAQRKLRIQQSKESEKDESHLAQGILYMVNPEHFNYAQAYKHLKIAAKQERNKRAYGYFALLHEHGLGAPIPAMDIALFFYAKADKRSVFMQLIEGVCYLRGFKNNYSSSGGEMAARLFKDAIILNEKTTIPDDLEMLRFIERVAREKPQENAALLLALIYKIGLLGKEKDELQADYFFNRVTWAQNAQLFYNLGKLYEGADWPYKNMLEAKQWYFLAANNGHTDAQFILGIFYRDALLGGEKNYKEALKWFQLAADEGGHKAAHQAMAEIYAKDSLDGIERDDEEADRRYKLAQTARNISAFDFNPPMPVEPAPMRPKSPTLVEGFFRRMISSNPSVNSTVIPTEGVQTVKVLYDWEGKLDHQLSVSRGEVLYLLRKVGDWLHCERRNHQDGMVPSSFVEELPLAKLATLRIKDLPAIALPISSKDIEEGRKLGEGACGEVYKGFWKQKKMDVAIKKLPPGSAWDYEGNMALRDFKRELHVMLQLRHPNIVALCAYTTDTETPHLIMEYMRGGSLWKKLGGRENKEIFLPWGMRFSIALNIGYGLKYLHKKKVIHRDLKSDNILLGEQGEARLADFGLSHLSTEAGGIKTFLSTEGKGTPAWMAPELFTALARYNERTDIYAFAVILWELLTHNVPYANYHNSLELIARFVLDEAKREAIPDTSETFKLLIEVGWSQDPCDRPTLRVMIEALKRGMETEALDGDILPRKKKSKDRKNEPKVEEIVSESEKAMQEEVKFNPITISDFDFEDMNDNGNCFYHAVASQMRVTGRRDFLDGVCKETALHDSLRSLVQKENFKDEGCVDVREIFDLMRCSNSVVAIINTNDLRRGFCCYFSNAEGEKKVSYIHSEVPKKQPIIRLAFTGKRYLSVRAHPALGNGGIQGAFDAENLFCSESTVSLDSSSSSSSMRTSRSSSEFFATRSQPSPNSTVKKPEMKFF